MEKSSIGARILEARERLGITQLDLAHAAGLQPSSISRYEKGKSVPSGTSIMALAKALRCDANWLLTGREPDAADASAAQSPEGYIEFVETFGHLFDDALVEALRGDVFGRFGVPAGEMTAKRYLELAQLLERARG